jgi:hypothetical protein
VTRSTPSLIDDNDNRVLDDNEEPPPQRHSHSIESSSITAHLNRENSIPMYALLAFGDEEDGDDEGMEGTLNMFRAGLGAGVVERWEGRVSGLTSKNMKLVVVEDEEEGKG